MSATATSPESLDIPPQRIAEFESGIEAANLAARSMRNKVVVAVGATGAGKSVLAHAYAERHPDVAFVEPDRDALFSGRKPNLDLALRKRPCIIDEPLHHGNIKEFVAASGDLVVLLLQHEGDVGELGLEEGKFLRVDVMPYPLWQETQKWLRAVQAGDLGTA